MTSADAASALRGLTEAYSTTGAAWQRGPGHVYDRLSQRVVRDAGIDWSGRRVLDVGAGTGAGSRALAAAGARPIAADIAAGMLRAATPRVPSAVADARALPIASNGIDGYFAAFCLNHLTDPHVALCEAARVVRPGGPVLVSAYAADDHHPVKAAVEAAAAELGWQPERWVGAMREAAIPLLATVEGALAVTGRTPLTAAGAEAVAVDFSDLEPAALVEWRLGMAQMAPFVGGLSEDARARLASRAAALLGDAPGLVRRIIVLHARA